MEAILPNSALSDLVTRGGVGPVWSNGHEILRRIFVTVRDRRWQEIAPTRWDSEVDDARRTITVAARHTNDQVDFEWWGTFHTTEDRRELGFEFAGKALRDMEICRLGLVVLHPVQSMVGARVTAISAQSEQSLSVANVISPQPIINGIPKAMTEPFSELLIQRSDVGSLAVRFEGDLFELEDQRNWGDASFKTYCTPLRLGFPRTVRAGTSIAHTVQICFTPASARERSNRFAPAGVTTAPGIFPAVGREIRSLSPQAQPDRDSPAWHHVHFVVPGEQPVEALREILESAPSAKIELGIETGGEQTRSGDMCALISAYHSRIARFLAYGVHTSVPNATVLESWRQQMQTSAALREVPVLAATRGYYVEFNRKVALDSQLSGMAFPLTATVHSDDAATIADNVATICDMAETARHLTQQNELVVAPLALYHPASMVPQHFPRTLIIPWLAATMIHCALARITSVTLSEDVVTALASTDLYALPFLSSLVESAGLEIVPLESDLPSRMHAAVFKSVTERPSRILAANVNAQPVRFTLAQTGLKAKTGRDAATGASFAVNEREIEIPGFATVWIELAGSGG